MSEQMIIRHFNSTEYSKREWFFSSEHFQRSA